MSQKLTAEQQDQLDRDELLMSPAFRRFTRRFFQSTCPILERTHVADAQTLSWREGRRSAALDLLDLLAARRPDALVLILSEPLITLEQPNGYRRYQHDTDRDDAD